MSLRHAPWEDAHEFAIGLRPIAPAAWLEGGEADPAARKDAVFETARPLVWAETPGSRPAQGEVLALVESALGRTIGAEGRPPLLAASRQVADDLCLMEKTDGQWRLSALSLSAGSFFAASDVIGRSLAELHGPVTGFEARFLARVIRMFDGLRPDLILERRNWSLVSSPDLHAPDPAPMRAVIADIDPARAADVLMTRVERQTLRRLPSGGVLFTIRVWLDPLARIAADPARLARFAHAWRSAPSDFRAYKRLDLYDALVERVIGIDAVTRPYIYLAVPCYGAQVNLFFAHSVVELQRACRAQGIGLHVDLMGGDALITRVRSRLTARFLTHPEATHLLFIDADIGFAPETVFRLLGSGKDMVAAVCPLKQIDWDKVRAAAKADVADLMAVSIGYVVRFLPTADKSVEVENGIAKVAYGGTGFLMVSRDAAQRLTDAHPELRARFEDGEEAVMLFDTLIEPETGQYLSEDYAICRRWRELGGEIWADVEARLSHVGHASYTGSLIQALRPGG